MSRPWQKNEAELGGVNAAGERYSRKWQAHKLEDWKKVGG